MSDVLRVVAGGILALVSSYIGLQIKRGYAEKVSFYKGMADFLRELRTDLSLMKTPITEFVDKYTAGRKGKAVALVREYATDLKENGRFDRDLDKWDCCHLSRIEKEEILSMLQSIGKTDLAEQRLILDKYEKVLEDRRKTAEDNLKRKGSMYFKLLVLLGIALMVVLC